MSNFMLYKKMVMSCIILATISILGGSGDSTTQYQNPCTSTPDASPDASLEYVGTGQFWSYNNITYRGTNLANGCYDPNAQTTSNFSQAQEQELDSLSAPMIQCLYGSVCRPDEIFTGTVYCGDDTNYPPPESPVTLADTITGALTATSQSYAPACVCGCAQAETYTPSSSILPSGSNPITYYQCSSGTGSGEVNSVPIDSSGHVDTTYTWYTSCAAPTTTTKPIQASPTPPAQKTTLWKYKKGSPEYAALEARGAQVYQLPAPNSNVCVIGKTYGGKKITATEVKQKCTFYAEKGRSKNNNGSMSITVAG